MIVFDNIGHFNIQTKNRGKIIVKIIISKHDVFQRNITIDNKFRIDGHDLLLPIEISLVESICGFTKSFQHIDNRNITFSISDIIQNNSIYTIHNEGLPNKENVKGNLYILIKINYSENITNQMKKTIYETITNHPYNPIQQSSNVKKIT
jgi:DnaJ-class molecular chaperone